ncbi:hypothetical protein C8035_v006391 [Colletotrichum spinosum]|uniref:Uncharacterized protein n=1 Tax=Colletotrichum spinosum TaxID=1347390 RepID=A0A4R8Q667_9PEZI|nr:hypothetical protein C8035_v006391 [Colletotrichum spinosum]
MNINFIKIIHNYKNYIYFYKSLKELVLYQDDFTTFSSLLEVAVVIFSLNIFLEYITISRVKKTNNKEESSA